MANVKLNNISKVYEGNVKAVENANFNINDKEFLVLVGPSGCGKSTILRMIAGLEEISSGELYIDGKLVNKLPPKDRDIAMVFQNYALYPHMSVYDNIAFGLKLRKFKKSDIEERVRNASEILGLNKLLSRKPKALSGGQRQRVALGRAIVRQPKVFLFDEPLSNLDAKLRVQMRTEISKLHKKLNATMVYVTHDQTEAMTMGDRIVVLKDGVVQQIDTPMNLYKYPKNKFVAGFIGTPAMNFIEGKIINNDKLIFEANDKSFNLPLFDDQRKIIKGKNVTKVTIGIRPEDIYLQSSNKFELKKEILVEVVEPMGNETFIYFKLGNSNIIARSQQNKEITAGQKIEIYLNQLKVYFFDQDEKRII